MAVALKEEGRAPGRRLLGGAKADLPTFLWYPKEEGKLDGRESAKTKQENYCTQKKRGRVKCWRRDGWQSQSDR